jgi:protein associated with RNAse G/E
MENYPLRVIKSFKHDGSLHRTWKENWLVPSSLLHPDHAVESIQVLINDHTEVQEGNGKIWMSKVPGVSFFQPNAWYNIVGLIEEAGVRYYCNIASPYYQQGRTLTYIDYDLDVIVMPNKQFSIVDQDEYEAHKSRYSYSAKVDYKVQQGLSSLLQRIHNNDTVFRPEVVMSYYEAWQNRNKPIK